MSVSSARQAVKAAQRIKNAPGRWEITLACGHRTIVTSKVKPSHAHCRMCSKPEAAA